MTIDFAGTFGPLVGLENVKQAIITLLSQPPTGGDTPLVVYYLAEIERQHGLAARTLTQPPSPDSYYGGIDHLSWDESLLPSIIVITQPTGSPERYGDGTYGQWFESQVAAVVQGNDEDDAQMIAAHYGSALTGALLENGDLGGIADKTELAEAAKLEFLEDPATRVFARAVVTVRSFVEPIAGDLDSPTNWPTDPYTPSSQPPVAETTDFVVVGEPLTEQQ